jgi:RNA polymerase sigma factor (sigma-70 family)
MSEARLTELRQLFIARYDELRTKLARRLGSIELASEALQDTWLKLSVAKAAAEVLNPRSYLLRTALNVAIDTKRSERRHLSAVEIESLIEFPDEAPGPGRVAEGRSSIRRLESILAELPPRQRKILLAARLDNMPRQEIADRLGISLRLVSKELREAQEYCLERRDEMDE